jgi:hypothetical protein
VQGPTGQGNIVERSLDGLYALGRVRVHRLLSFHLDFQLQKLVLALKMEIIGDYL